MTPAIHVDHLNKTFAKKSALVDLELTVATGEMVALIGASGSGKSTLLRHLAGLACCDKSNGGSVKVLGREVQASGRLNGKVRRLRADIGYIFQQFNLVNRLSVLDNVLLGCLGRMPRWRATSVCSTPRKNSSPWNPWPASAWQTWPASAPPPCPAASSNAWQSPAL